MDVANNDVASAAYCALAVTVFLFATDVHPSNSCSSASSVLAAPRATVLVRVPPRRVTEDEEDEDDMTVMKYSHVCDCSSTKRRFTTMRPMLAAEWRDDRGRRSGLLCNHTINCSVTSVTVIPFLQREAHRHDRPVDVVDPGSRICVSRIDLQTKLLQFQEIAETCGFGKYYVSSSNYFKLGNG